MEETNPRVWFANEQQINSQTRINSLTDRGSLHLEPGQLRFTSRRQTLEIKNIQGVELISPPVPWISTALLALALPLVFFIVDHPSPDLLMAYLFIWTIIFLVSLPVWGHVQKTTLWIEIAYLDDNHALRRAYFSPIWRWNFDMGGSMIDDTLQIYRELRSALLPAG